jgi:dephospho-CoA kinase
MIVVGLTGSIAMGKSTVGAMFAREGVPLFDSDAAVHEAYRGPGALVVEAAFPGVIDDGVIDRDRLAQRVIGDSAALAWLEAMVHPMIEKMRQDFLSRAAAQQKRLVVVDVPLLFESGAHRSVDVIVVVSASEAVQKTRALGRHGMTLPRFEQIIARQAPDSEKRRRAHTVIDTNGALGTTRAQVQGFLRSVAAMPGKRAAAHA